MEGREEPEERAETADLMGRAGTDRHGQGRAETEEMEGTEGMGVRAEAEAGD